MFTAARQRLLPRFAFLAAISLVFAAGCGDDDDPTEVIFPVSVLEIPTLDGLGLALLALLAGAAPAQDVEPVQVRFRATPERAAPGEAVDVVAEVVVAKGWHVYGPRETHKGEMASVAFHLFNQVSRGENPRLFGAYGCYGPGEQSRDFVHVADVADVNLWFRDRGVSGIYNCGTGRAEPFRRVAETVTASLGKGEIEFVDFPDKLKGRYQSFTQADISRLRAAGYNGDFRDVESGVADYMEWLKAWPSS